MTEERALFSEKRMTLKELGLRRPLLKGAGFLLVMAVVALLIIWPAWTYLKLRWSPHARALWAAQGERVAYLSNLSSESVIGEGTLEKLELRCTDSLGLFILRIKIAAPEDHRYPGESTQIGPRSLNRIEPLEGPSQIGTSDPADMLLSVTCMGVLYLLGGMYARMIRYRALANHYRLQCREPQSEDCGIQGQSP